MCPICLEVIQDSTKSKKVMMQFFARGQCNSWLHRGYAGLPKSVFTSLQNSPDPFYYPHCQFTKHATTILDLKVTIASLTETIMALQNSVKSLEPTSAPVSIPDNLST